jgi:hypothetical protein
MRPERASKWHSSLTARWQTAVDNYVYVYNSKQPWTSNTSITRETAQPIISMLTVHYKTHHKQQTRKPTAGNTNIYQPVKLRNILSRVWVTIDGVLDWILNLLTIYTHNSELQIIAAPSLISTFYKSLEHLLILFQPVVSSPAVLWQRLLTMEILQLPRSGPLWMAAPFQLNLFFTDSHTELTWLPKWSSL